MQLDEARELVEAKFRQLLQSAREARIEVELDPSVIDRIVALSGGHPHILQLLGSHVVEHEAEDPDGIIDSRDFLNSLRRICFEDRAAVYTATIHQLQLLDKYDSLLTLFGLTAESPLNICSRTFPTVIDADLARENIPVDHLDWLVRNNVLRSCGESYGLIDEFLRIRVSLDLEEVASAGTELETVNLDDVRGYQDEIVALDPEIMRFSQAYNDID